MNRAETEIATLQEKIEALDRKREAYKAKCAIGGTFRGLGRYEAQYWYNRKRYEAQIDAITKAEDNK